MGKISKGVNCSVNGCSNAAVRSLNTNRVKEAGLDVSSGSKQSYLCREHYKQWKKEMKQSDRDDVALRYGGGF
ncbi:MAG: hypothetical protein QXU32_03730 [Nitrososphaerales archaeon]